MDLARRVLYGSAQGAMYFTRDMNDLPGFRECRRDGGKQALRENFVMAVAEVTQYKMHERFGVTLVDSFCNSGCIFSFWGWHELCV